jgi:hypothetical protein
VPTEKRSFERVRVNLDTFWTKGSERSSGVIKDMGRRGCFIATSGEAKTGDFVELEVHQPSVMHLIIKGVISRVSRGRGIAVVFRDLSVTENALLERFLQVMRDNIVEAGPNKP